MSDSFKRVHKGLTFRPQTVTPSNPTQGDLWYDNATNRFIARINTVSDPVVTEAANQILSNKTVYFSVGSAAAPSVTFTGDTDTGLYDTADTINFTTAGVHRAALSSASLALTMPFRTTYGTPSAPAFSFTVETNSGMYLESAGILALSVAGTKYLEVKSAATINRSTQFQVALGSSAAPSFTFESDSDTGIYRLDANRLAFACGGAFTGAINGSGQFQALSMTAAAPTYSFFGDPDTGIYNPSANAVGIAAQGVQAAQFGANVGQAWLQLTNSTSYATFYSGATDQYLAVSGGTSSVLGGNIKLYAQSHATKAWHIEFYKDSTLNGSCDDNGLWTLGASGGTQTHAINGRFTSTLNATIGSSTIDTRAILSLGYASSPLTGVDQWGLLSQITGTNAATTSIFGVRSLTSIAASANTTTLAAFYGSLGAGGGNTIGAGIIYAGTYPTVGTAKAFLTDNSGLSGSWGIYLNTTNANYFAGESRFGSSTTVQNSQVEAQQLVSANNSAFALYARARNDFDGAVSNTTNAVFIDNTRSITTSQTDTQQLIGLQIRTNWSVPNTPSIQTLTNNNASDACADLRLRSSVLAGGGALAYNHYAKLNINADATVTGTNKYGMYIGAMSGATNNWQLYSNGAAPSYFLGSIRTGTAATIDSGVDEQLTVYLNGVAGTPFVAANARSNLSGSSNNDSTMIGVQARVVRTATGNIIETGTRRALSARLTLAADATFTHTNNAAIGQVAAITAVGPDTPAGTLEIAHLSGISIIANSINTGTNKYGLYIGSQTGADNNWQLYSDGTSPSYFAGAMGVNGSPLSSSILTLGGATAVTSGTTQTALDISQAFNTTGATQSAQCVRLIPTTAAGTYNMNYVTGLRLTAPVMNHTGTLSYAVQIRADMPTVGSGNAILADNIAFGASNWIFNFSSTNKSLFGGSIASGTSNSGAANFEASSGAMLTGADVKGFYANILSPSTATGSVRGVQVNIGTAAGSYTCDQALAFCANAITKANTTINYAISYYGAVPTVGSTGNAWAADNVSFTGNWAIHSNSSNASHFAGPMEWTHIATPANPAAGHNRIYFKSDGNLYKLDSGGTEQVFTTGAGGGDISQGGNSFTTNMTIGTNDAFALNLETNNTPRLTISSTGTAAINASPSTSYGLWIDGTTILSAGGARGAYYATGSIGATSTLSGYYTNVTNTASAVTTRNQFWADTAASGGGTITRDIAFRAAAPTAGTNNAIFADNITFTGDHGICLNTVRTNWLAGGLLVGGGVTVPSGGTTQNWVLRIYDTSGSFLSSGTQYQILNTGTFTSAGVDAIYGISSQVQTPNTTFTTTFGASFYAYPANKGANHTITRFANFYSPQPTTVGGTSPNYRNANFTDDASFATGNWGIYLSTANPSYFAGPLFSGTNNSGYVGSSQGKAVRLYNGTTSDNQMGFIAASDIITDSNLTAGNHALVSYVRRKIATTGVNDSNAGGFGVGATSVVSTTWDLSGAANNYTYTGNYAGLYIDDTSIASPGTGTVTITGAYSAIRIGADSTALTTAKYGLYIGAISGGTVANYQLYSPGTSPSYFAGPIYIADGSAAAPALAFNSSTNSGLRWSVSGPKMVQNGYDVVTWTGTASEVDLVLQTPAAGIGALISNDNSGSVNWSANTSTNTGRNIFMYGNSHATKAGALEFRSGTTIQGQIVAGGEWYIPGQMQLGNNGSIVGAQVEAFKGVSTDVTAQAFYARSRNSTDGNVSSTINGGFFETIRGALTLANPTDTSSQLALIARTQWSIGAQTLTNNIGIGGIADIRASQSNLTVAGGTLALAHYCKIAIETDSTPTGTNKYGLYIGAQSAATNNFQIYSTGTAPSRFAGPIQFADGNAASPSITFSADSDTGIYRYTANYIGFACDGAEAAYLGNSSGDIVFKGLQLTTKGFYIQNTITDGLLSFSGGSSSTSGAVLSLYGPSHGSKPGSFEFLQSNVLVGRIASSGQWTIGTALSTQTQTINAGKILVNWGYLNGANEMELRNTDTTSINAFSRIMLTTQSTNTQVNCDPIISFIISGAAAAWDIKADNDDADRFKIQYGAVSRIICETATADVLIPNGGLRSGLQCVGPQFASGSTRESLSAYQVGVAGEEANLHAGLGVRTYIPTTMGTLTAGDQAGIIATFGRNSTGVASDTGGAADARAAILAGLTYVVGTSYTDANSHHAAIDVWNPTLTGGSLAITNLSGIRIRASAVNTGTNKYGLYIDAQTGAANNYQLYSNGTAPSHFAGPVQMAGVTDASNATAGDVGEHVESSISTFTNYTTTNTWGNITSISLTAGDWDVTGLVQAETNGATITAHGLAISVNSGNTTTDHVTGKNVLTFLPPTSSASSGGSVPSYRINVSTTTTVYLKGIAIYSAGTPRYVGTITARRRR